MRYRALLSAAAVLAVVITIASVLPADVTNIILYGELRDIDGDGTKDFELTVLKVQPSDEIDYSKNGQYAQGAAVYMDGQFKGLTNETGNYIIYNISAGAHEVKAEYNEGGQVFTDVWWIDKDPGASRAGLGNVGIVISIIVGGIILAAVLVWVVDKLVKKTDKGKTKKKEWTECKECGARVKTKNLDIHLYKVHKKR